MQKNNTRIYVAQIRVISESRHMLPKTTTIFLR